MKIVGITGGMGSGKTTVANMFAALGVPIYIADVEAKFLIDSSGIIRGQLSRLLGAEVYKGNKLDRKYMAEKIFGDKALLFAANSIIHPRVAEHFKEWTNKQKTPYVLKEAAILFESGSYKECDFVILVTAPKEIRIQRIKERDQLGEEQILERMSNQWNDSEKRILANYCLENIERSETQKQVLRLHENFLHRFQ